MNAILFDVVRWLFNILTALIFIRVLLSWMPIVRGGRIIEFLYAFTEPILAPIRKLIDRSPLGGPGMMLDFSPIIAIFIISLIRSFLLSLISGLL